MKYRFTLAELLVGIVIVAVLVAALAPALAAPWPPSRPYFGFRSTP
jgi:prepilin-type N-terminal cleavage/methylation domain-containing protein